jgi:hypothetical protein
MNGKRTTKKVCEDGVQEGLARIQKDKAQDEAEALESDEEALGEAFLEAFYEAFKPRWGC